MNWTLSSMNFKRKCRSKRYHIKHSKIRFGEVCERPYRQAWWNKNFNWNQHRRCHRRGHKESLRPSFQAVWRTKENYSPMVHYMVGEILEPVMMKMASLMKQRSRVWRQVSKKKYIVRCPHCNHGMFDADYADVEIKCPVCRKVFEVKLEKKRGKKWINLAQSHKGSEWLTYRAWQIVLKTICQLYLCSRRRWKFESDNDGRGIKICRSQYPGYTSALDLWGWLMLLQAGSNCDSKGKHPLYTGWYKNSTTDVKQINKWWRKAPMPI